ncbi:MAG: hypothetical protein AB1476_01710 [Candidatus Hadarchaeota archaeon]
MPKDGGTRERWDFIYRTLPPEEIPWEAGRPDPDLVTLVRKKKIKKGRVLDTCAGLGTHSIYLAKRGFEVSGIDISPPPSRRLANGAGRRG